MKGKQWLAFKKLLDHPVVRVIGAIIAVGAVVFTVTTYYINRPIYRLDAVKLFYREYPEEPVVPADTEHQVEVQVLFDGKPVQGLKQLVIGIRNSGNRVIKRSDYETLYLSFPESVTLLSVDIGEKPSKEMFFDASIQEQRPGGPLEPVLPIPRVDIDFEMLKAGENVSLAIFLQGDLPEGFPKLKGRSIATLRSLSQYTPPTLARATEREALFTALASIITFVATFVLLYLINKIYKKKLIDEINKELFDKINKEED